MVFELLLNEHDWHVNHHDHEKNEVDNRKNTNYNKFVVSGTDRESHEQTELG